jgi:four helix bundle protein
MEVTMARRFKDLKVWEYAHEMVLKVYKMTAAFPAEERYALTSQMKRAALSVPANIAEGVGRKSSKEFAQSLIIARGSLSETEYYLLLAKDLNYISDDDYKKAILNIKEIGRMLNGLINSISE